MQIFIVQGWRRSARGTAAREKILPSGAGNERGKAPSGGKSILPLPLVAAFARNCLLKGRPDARGGFRPFRPCLLLLFVLGLVELAVYVRGVAQAFQFEGFELAPPGWSPGS